MKTIQIEIPDGKKAEWVDGVLTLVDEQPKDITERIKTPNDAYQWCVENGKREMLHTYSIIFEGLLNSEPEITEDVDDIIAYLKLRIITAALNEGWEPTFAEDELRYYCICDADGGALRVVSATKIGDITPYTLYFKTRELALYAATQFADIYTDFCYKGKEGKA